MSHKDPYASYRGLLRRWNNQCVLCGCEFKNMESITREHLIPRSAGGSSDRKNIAPAHFRCNQFRADMSLLKAMKMIETKKTRMNENNFNAWINASVPNRRPMVKK
jgi:5-methylcytosine-specific restriction endonuclease McrA